MVAVFYLGGHAFLGTLKKDAGVHKRSICWHLEVTLRGLGWKKSHLGALQQAVNTPVTYHHLIKLITETQEAPVRKSNGNGWHLNTWLMQLRYRRLQINQNSFD